MERRRVILKSRALCILFVSAWISRLAIAQPVIFNDAHLKAAVESALGSSDPNATDMLNLTFLSATSIGIRDLTGLEAALNLQKLVLTNNRIQNLSALSGPTQLQQLFLADNQISNVSALSGLTNVLVLELENNHISDISALSGLASLNYLDLRNNPLNPAAYATHLPKIEHFAATVLYYLLPDVSTYPAKLVTDSSALLKGILVDNGGVTCQRRFRYWIQGQRNQTEQATEWRSAEENKIFTELISDLSSNTVYRYVAEAQNLVGMGVGAEREFTTLASDPNSQSEPGTLYVDDDNINDPGPFAAAISDPNEDGTQVHPFDSIQEAINAAKDHHDTIQVAEGRYYETINLMGKHLHLNGLDPNTAKMIDLPVIDANGLGPVLTFAAGEDANCVVTGFVLTGGLDEQAGAVACINSSPVLQHCLIVGNRITDPNGGAVYLQDSNSVFVSCTIADNTGLKGGAGVTMLNSDPVILNSILWNNIPVEILSLDLSMPVVAYSAVLDSWPGTGNLIDDPLLAIHIWRML